jgi:hypothetical protein
MATATMVFSEPKVPLLWDVSATLLDVELAYDFSVILTEPEYSTYQFSRFFWYRSRSRISEGSRLSATQPVPGGEHCTTASGRSSGVNPNEEICRGMSSQLPSRC